MDSDFRTLLKDLDNKALAVVLDTWRPPVEHSLDGIVYDLLNEAARRLRAEQAVPTPAEIKLLINGQKIQAIRALKDRTGLNLRESKNAVDSWMNQAGIGRHGCKE
jgi:hypothetical protein